MDKQNFQPAVPPAIGQDTRAFLTHACLTGNPRPFSAETFIFLQAQVIPIHCKT
jgi:hypothetical protein